MDSDSLQESFAPRQLALFTAGELEGQARLGSRCPSKRGLTVSFLRFPSAAINIELVVLTHSVPALVTNKVPLTRFIIFHSIKYRIYLTTKLAMFLTRSYHYSNTLPNLQI